MSKEKLLQFSRVYSVYKDNENGNNVIEEKALNKLIHVAKELSIYYAEYPNNISSTIHLENDVKEIQDKLEEEFGEFMLKVTPEKIRKRIHYFSDLYYEHFA